MGYTNYYYTPKKFNKVRFKAFAKDVKAIFEHSQNVLGIKLADGYGELGTEPIIDIEDKVISFNGVDSESHESLYISDSHRNAGENGLCFNFCKTARKPYDVVVVAVLVALKHHFPECVISSDGDDKDWLDGKILCNNVLGYGLNFQLSNNED